MSTPYGLLIESVQVAQSQQEGDSLQFIPDLSKESSVPSTLHLSKTVGTDDLGT